MRIGVIRTNGPKNYFVYLLPELIFQSLLPCGEKDIWDEAETIKKHSLMTFGFGFSSPGLIMEVEEKLDAWVEGNGHEVVGSYDCVMA